jgi:hypothetical protein
MFSFPMLNCDSGFFNIEYIFVSELFNYKTLSILLLNPAGLSDVGLKFVLLLNQKYIVLLN